MGVSQRRLDVREGIRRRVARRDAGTGQPVPAGQAAVEGHDRLEEVDDVLVLDVLGPVAGHVKGAVARGVFRELVRPEVGVGLALRHPVPVHVRQQVVPAERPQEGPDVGPRVRRHGGPRGRAGRGVWRRGRVVLPAQVAVLRVRAVAEVGPQAVEGPCVLGEDLALGLVARVDVPQLCGQYQAAERLGAA